MIGFSAPAAYAHHSNAASFTDIPITVEGYVDDYLFKNPHVIVYLYVTDKDTGETVRWMSEGPAATGLRLAGWNQDTLKKGDYIRITGDAGRNNRPMVNLRNVIVVDPATGAAIRSINEKRNIVTASDPDSPDFSYPAKTADGLPNLEGIWVQGGDGPNPSFLANLDPVLSPKGQAIQDTISALNDPQYIFCEPANLVRQAGFTPHPVRISQHEDRVAFEYEEYSGERVIYLDGRDYDSFDDNERYRLGRYKAYYKDEAFVIESDLLKPGWSSIFGQVISDQAKTVETYTRQFDPKWGPSVHLSMVITDPENLKEPWEMAWNKYYTVSGFTGTERDNVQKDYVMLPVDCQIPLTSGDGAAASIVTPTAPDLVSSQGGLDAQKPDELNGSKIWLYLAGLFVALLAIFAVLRIIREQRR